MTDRWRFVVLLLGFPGIGICVDDPCRAAEEQLPTRRMVLFTSGVSFVQRAGTVEGTVDVPLTFATDQINDLLKSLVVRDLDGGRVDGVNYESQDPLARTLQSFSVNLDGEVTLAGFLGQLRGERLVLNAATRIEGVLLSVEQQTRPVAEAAPAAAVTESYLNLLTDGGLRRVNLNSVTELKLVNEQLDAEVRKALALIAGSRRSDAKRVTLRLAGEGKRRVAVGYVQAAPVWKTSYRLVLNEQGEAYLQGWALVENTTAEDWQGVELLLVSGHPISFRMNLYEPRYLERPLVQLTNLLSVMPTVHALSFAAEDRFDVVTDGKVRDQLGYRMYWGDISPDSKSVRVSVQAGKVGELFQFRIDTPVTLPRNQSAMLPIVSTEIPAEKVSIYNADYHATHPLHAVRLHNTTGLHLMQGPMTVFDDDVYAGDARLGDLSQGDRRLISYALNAKTEVRRGGSSQPAELLSCRIVQGVLHVVRKVSRSQHYTVRNSSETDQIVLIEHPRDSTWKLVGLRADEETADLYRFTVDAAAGNTIELEVNEQQQLSETVAVLDLDDASTQIYLNASVVSDSVKEALRGWQKQRADLKQVQREKTGLEDEINEIATQQERIRENLANLPQDSDLYRRYLSKLTSQEDHVDQLQASLRQLRQSEGKLQAELDTALQHLNAM